MPSLAPQPLPTLTERRASPASSPTTGANDILRAGAVARAVDSPAQTGIPTEERSTARSASQPCTRGPDATEVLVLRAATPADAAPLLAMLEESAVAAWWGHNDLASITEELEGHFAIVVDGVVAGLLEAHQETAADCPSVAFDIFLGTAFHRRGLGPRALRVAVDYFIALGHHRFSIDPAVANEAAIRAYSAVGFRPVGVMRDAERSPAGEWRDALLMDLLARDLAGNATTATATANEDHDPGRRQGSGSAA